MFFLQAFYNCNRTKMAQLKYTLMMIRDPVQKKVKIYI